MASWLAAQVLNVQAQPKSNLKDPRSYTIVGQSLPRVDIPAKVTGQVAYVHDLRLEGMVHARVVMPPSYGAKLKSVDTARVEKMPGVKKVVRDGNFLAVIADREFRAVKAMEVLTAAAHWDERETMPSQADFYSWLKQQKAKPITVRDDKAQAAPATKTLEAEYLRPYQMHAAIGPACARRAVRRRQPHRLESRPGHVPAASGGIAARRSSRPSACAASTWKAPAATATTAPMTPPPTPPISPSPIPARRCACNGRATRSTSGSPMAPAW